MDDLFAAIGLVLIIEGLVWALIPNYGVRMLEAVQDMPAGTLRLIGLASVLLGAMTYWLVRG